MIAKATGPAILEVRGLNVYYGASHALQGVDLTLSSGVLSVVGRNGMGKTTLCKAIMGMVPASGSIRLAGQEILGRSSTDIARMGVGYVPQGRRLWRSLTVDEHLKLMAKPGGNWSVERIYSTFPRLAERKNNGGGQLSGGESQMLAIARALLLNPRLLVMDEPTEGLAPVIVAHVEDMLLRLAEEGAHVLVIEQNIGVACEVAPNVAIMVNGRVDRLLDAGQLAADRDLQQRLLGVGRHAHDETPEPQETVRTEAAPKGPAKVYVSNPVPPTRWSKPVSVRLIEQRARTVSTVAASSSVEAELRPLAGPGEAVVLVAGPLASAGEALRHMRDLVRARGHAVRLVDLSTTPSHTGAEIPAHQIAAFHPRGASGVFVADPHEAAAGMALAFERWIARQSGIAGLLAAGGDGAALGAMRRLPVGVPKLIVTAKAPGEVAAQLGAADIAVMHAVVDPVRLDAVTRRVLANAAHAMAGMVETRPALAAGLPAVGITASRATAACAVAVEKGLARSHECVRLAAGEGGAALEALIDQGLVKLAIDLTPSDVADWVVAGQRPSTEARYGAAVRHKLPFIGSVGGLDRVRFGAADTVPGRFRARPLHPRSAATTLMRTSAEECAAIGRFIGERINRMDNAHLLLPTGGLSALDAPGGPLHDPAADAALFEALEKSVRQSASRQVLRLPHHINDPAFAAEIVRLVRQLSGGERSRRAS